MADNPAERASAIVQAATHFDQPKLLADVSAGLGRAMHGQTKTTERVTLGN